jgi:hypothetical protein
VPSDGLRAGQSGQRTGAPGSDTALFAPRNHDRSRACRAGLAFMAGEQVLDERGYAVVLLAIEVGVFEEVEVARATDSSNFAQYVNGVLIKGFEILAVVFSGHGADYINLMKALNSTLVLPIAEM